MKKLTSLSLAAVGASLVTVGVVALLNYREYRHQLTVMLKDMRDDLELDCDLINSTAEEIPEVVDSEAKREFRATIDAAINFATSVYHVYALLDDDRLSSLSPQTTHAYIECLRAIIRNAEAHIMAIDVARDRLKDETQAKTDKKS